MMTTIHRDMKVEEENQYFVVERNCQGYSLKDDPEMMKMLSEGRFRDGLPVIVDGDTHPITMKCRLFYDRQRKASPVCMGACLSRGAREKMCSCDDYDKKCATVDPTINAYNPPKPFAETR